MNHLVFVAKPGPPRFFLWPAFPVDGASSVAGLVDAGHAVTTRVVDEKLAENEVAGRQIDLWDALPPLAALTTEEIDRAPASVAAWSLAAKLALELVGRERIVPGMRRAADGSIEARWRVALALPEDTERVQALARALPPAAYASPAPSVVSPKRGAGATPKVEDPEALVRDFLDEAADAIVRKAASVARGTTPRKAGELGPGPWERRFVAALSSNDAAFSPTGFHERALEQGLEAWARPALGAEAGVPRVCLRLELPEEELPHFALRYFLQAADDPSLLVGAGEIWGARAAALARLGRLLGDPAERLLEGLAVAARIFAPIERSLRERRPAGVALDASEAWAFLGDAAPALAEAGIAVIVPAELTPSGRRRLRLRMRVGGRSAPAAGAVAGASGLGLDEVTSFRWEATLAGDTLSASELAALAKLKAPLVRWRGHWVAVAPNELDEVRHALGSRGEKISVGAALAAALLGSTQRPHVSVPVDVVAEGRLAGVLERLRSGQPDTGGPPPGLAGTLRPYQRRGVAWLCSMAGLGLGACLADDMGLGKTIQLIGFLLQRAATRQRRPSLIVCPTSVVGNWERELARFAPGLPVVEHYGADRQLPAEGTVAGAVVLTTYGLLRRDAEALGAIAWDSVVLDEAQNIKNSASRTAQAARSLEAAHRIALTGTPVENRLAELWSILEFGNPRLLGPLAKFRRDYAVPIERYHDNDAAERLRRIVAPFVLRRLKSDPAIVEDLPPKNEMKVVCSLTKEQGSLYRAAVDEALRKIASAEGIQRRGLVLSLITALKQICNHPAQYLGERGPLAGRSGKLARLGEMLEEVIAAGDRVLVFSQFREMGTRLVEHLGRVLGVEIAFLHGGVPRPRRDEMVRRFQDDPRGPRIFVLSVKAGGTGLNLTAASHVFHFDRWWNPAVEDQATDRAHRIGQKRSVQVHKLLTAGTVEEKIDRMLEDKRDLASRIVGAGEQWISELGDEALRELFSLAPNAVVDPEGAS